MCARGTNNTRLSPVSSVWQPRSSSTASSKSATQPGSQERVLHRSFLSAGMASVTPVQGWKRRASAALQQRCSHIESTMQSPCGHTATLQPHQIHNAVTLWPHSNAVATLNPRCSHPVATQRIFLTIDCTASEHPRNVSLAVAASPEELIR
jgi:hypothetical protein